jgi:hypothetical protein
MLTVEDKELAIAHERMIMCAWAQLACSTKSWLRRLRACEPDMRFAGVEAQGPLSDTAWFCRPWPCCNRGTILVRHAG